MKGWPPMGEDASVAGPVRRLLIYRMGSLGDTVVALPAPTDREKTQMYVQRYMAHFPAAGEIILFTAIRFMPSSST